MSLCLTESAAPNKRAPAWIETQLLLPPEQRSPCRIEWRVGKPFITFHALPSPCKISVTCICFRILMPARDPIGHVLLITVLVARLFEVPLRDIIYSGFLHLERHVGGFKIVFRRRRNEGKPVCLLHPAPQRRSRRSWKACMRGFF
jgi:hypothetical protein